MEKFTGISSRAVDQPPPPAINSLYEATKGLAEATGAFHEMADRLCGNQPEAVSNKLDAPQAASFFGQIEDNASEVRDLTSRIMSDIRRIQNRL